MRPHPRGGNAIRIATPPRTRFSSRAILDCASAARGNEMKRLTFILIACACAIAHVRFARAESACPATIVVEQKGSAPAPDWTVTYSGYQTAIAGVTIFDGPPAEQASLAPDSEKPSGDNIYPDLAIAEKRSRLLAAVQLCEYHRADFAALAGERFAMRRRAQPQRALQRRRVCSQERELQVGDV